MRYFAEGGPVRRLKMQRVSEALNLTVIVERGRPFVLKRQGA